MYLRSEGFDTYGAIVANAELAQWSEFNGDLETTNARTGEYCCEFSQNEFNRIALGGPKTTVISGFAFRPNFIPAGDMLQIWRYKDSTNAPQVTIGTTSTGALRAMRGDYNGTLLGTSADLVFGAEAYNFIECKVTIDDTEGAIEVRVNQVTVLNLTGIDTKNTSESTISQFEVGHRSSGSSQTYQIDDLYLLDDTGDQLNDFIGDHAVLEDVADGDGAFTEWTSNISGDLYEAVDEIPQDGDTSFIQAAAVYDRASFTFPDLDPSYTGVSAVEMFYIGKKNNTGEAAVQILAESGGTEGAGDIDSMTEQYSGYSAVFELDPFSGLPWSISGTNNVEMILDRTA